ncbi:hypothetical protein IFM89_025278, partial [Coptis chinensis]
LSLSRVAIKSKIKQVGFSNFNSLTSEELDAYLKDAKEQLNAVEAENAKISDDIKVLRSTYVEATGLGHITCFEAKCIAIVLAAEKAVEVNCTRLWIEADSQAAVTAFNGASIPCVLKARWIQAN